MGRVHASEGYVRAIILEMIMIIMMITMIAIMVICTTQALPFPLRCYPLSGLSLDGWSVSTRSPGQFSDATHATQVGKATERPTPHADRLLALLALGILESRQRMRHVAELRPLTYPEPMAHAPEQQCMGRQLYHW